MPTPTRLARLVRFATLPETRGAVVAAARSAALRGAARRAVNDPAGLVRELRNPGSARDLARRAVQHPATQELADVGLMFLPGRYLPLGWAAGWAARRILRRYIDPRSEALDESSPRPGRPAKNVTPKGHR